MGQSEGECTPTPSKPSQAEKVRRETEYKNTPSIPTHLLNWSFFVAASKGRTRQSRSSTPSRRVICCHSPARSPRTNRDSTHRERGGQGKVRRDRRRYRDGGHGREGGVVKLVALVKEV
ncbi:hypothetical protein Fcan01_10145 [Folsomia candida]|uniref:Uncharacterized protein n=1 Tax=Folsomia candida TaxID=158441 RepID=A0A226E8W2_FOLCA|nr:hypothetical protein Fcan01_10145 [Folsomia candida]